MSFVIHEFEALVCCLQKEHNDIENSADELRKTINELYSFAN